MSLGLCVGACDCMTVDVVDSCTFPHINDDARSKSHQIPFTHFS